jgi:flagellar basal-body rod protein FlgF
MDSLSIAAASGLQSRMDSLDLLANNLANAGTSGYKSDREFYGLFVSPEAENPMGDDAVTTLPVVERGWTDFSQGTLQVTGNPLDIALQGPGFLAVNGPNGPLYTRDGSLKVSAAGELVTAEGYPIRTVGADPTKGGDPIKVVPDQPISIGTDGSVQQGGQTLGQLEIVNFKSTASLKKLNGSGFQNTDAQNKPVPATTVQVEQGKIETSNVGVPESAMRLVGLMRQFEMLQKAVSLDADMNKKAIEEVARVGS